MKTLSNHVIIYDDECPMCDLYTDAFVKSGMLDHSGREAYSAMNCNLRKTIDIKRASNEIALVDLRNGKVTYGIDSLFKILGNSIPLFKPLFSWKAFRWLMKNVYAFISYNRKVIVPGKKLESENSCTPTFNVRYRLMYILFTWIITSLILNAFTQHLVPVVPKSNLLREFLICGGQIIFQLIVVTALRKEKVLHYLGNMMTISFAGALLLLPAILIANLQLVASPLFYLIWFAVVVALMFAEHIRRVKILELHWSASLSWVVYRLIILMIIIFTVDSNIIKLSVP